jgi:alkaline phosphatase D
MPRRLTVRLLLVLLVLGGFAAIPGSAGAVGFSYGVTAGDVTSSSAILWGRANGRATVILQVARNRGFRGRSLRTFRVRARRSHDYSVRRRVRRLRANKRYWFRFVHRGRRSPRGTFRTAPTRRQDVRVRFGWTGDTDFNSAPGQRGPFWNRGGVFRRLRAERNHFNVHLGDTMYSDSEIPGRLRPIATTVRRKWAKYKTNLRNGHLRRLRGSAGFYSHWDDHEFINDFSPAESTFSNNVNINGRTLYRRGVAAFRDYAPVTYSRRNGIYRSFRWGRNLEVFFLDQRSFRSAKADEGGVCNNPQTGEPDVAPTAPQGHRNAFGAAVPATGLSQPVSQACLDAIRSPNRTFLGRRQMNRFKNAVQNSTARWKVIMNEMPIQQYYVLPYDRWEGYESERQELLGFLRNNVRNVVFLTTDVHATLVNDARMQTLEQGGPVNTGIFDFVVGPAATANFQLEINQETGNNSAGQLVDTAFFTPDPPVGVGMRCSILDQFSYGQVTVTRDRLTIRSKGIDGRPQSECPPLVLIHQ